MKILRLLILYIRRWWFLAQRSSGDYWWFKNYVEPEYDSLTSQIEKMKNEISRK